MNQKISRHKMELIKQMLPALLRASHGFKYLFSQAQGAGDTTVLQLQALSLLQLHPKSSAKELGASLYLSSSATTQLLQRLLDAGWVTREHHATDRRMIKISVTKKGRSVLQRYGREKFYNVKDVFATLSDDELQSLTIILTKLHNTMQEHQNE